VDVLPCRDIEVFIGITTTSKGIAILRTETSVPSERYICGVVVENLRVLVAHSLQDNPMNVVTQPRAEGLTL